MADEKKEAVLEEVKSCAGCGKPIKRARRYYRNGKYYCNNNCFKGKGKAAKKEDKGG